MLSWARVAYRTPPCRRQTLRPSARSRPRGTSAGSGASRQMTGSNSEPSARSARSRSSAAAWSGSLPDRGSTRPRYLTRSARVQVLFSCCASATACCAARLSRSSDGTVSGASPSLVRCAGLRAPACHTDGATSASRTPRLRASRSAQSACNCSASSVASLDLRVAKFDACANCASSRWDGPRPYCCSNRAARPRRSAVIDSRREENRRIISPGMPVISKP